MINLYFNIVKWTIFLKNDRIKVYLIVKNEEMLFYFSKDKYTNKSSKDLKDLIEQYKESETDLLQFDFTKRENARKTAFIIFDVAEHLTLLKDGKSKYTLEQAVEELTKAQNLLNPIMDKYDYKKLPKRN